MTIQEEIITLKAKAFDIRSEITRLAQLEQSVVHGIIERENQLTQEKADTGIPVTEDMKKPTKKRA